MKGLLAWLVSLTKKVRPTGTEDGRLVRISYDIMLRSPE